MQPILPMSMRPDELDRFASRSIGDRALPGNRPYRSNSSSLNSTIGSNSSGGRVHFVVLGRSRRLMDHCTELKKLGEEHGNVDGEVRKTIGDVAAALVAVGCEAGLVVLQAAKKDD